MVTKIQIAVVFVLSWHGVASALEPDEILVIANRQISASERIAEYYCEKRKIPKKNIIYLALPYQSEGSCSEGFPAKSDVW